MRGTETPSVGGHPREVRGTETPSKGKDSDSSDSRQTFIIVLTCSIDSSVFFSFIFPPLLQLLILLAL